MSNQEFFVKVPHNLVKAPISDRAVRLFAVLGIYRNNETGLAWPRLDTLADVMGCSVSSVRRAREELETIGAIDSKQRFNASTVYTVNVSSPLNKVTITDDEGGVTGETKSVTGENKSVTGENKSFTGEQLTRTIKLKPIELDPLNLIDPKVSGITILKAQLAALIRSGWGAGDYAPTNNYGDPLEELTEAIRVDPDGVEKKLKKKTKTAKNLDQYIETILKTNPWILLPDYWENMDDEIVTASPSAPISGPKTSSAGTSAPTPVEPPQRPLMLDGVSAHNMAWLSDQPSESELRSAEIASALGFDIPEGMTPEDVDEICQIAQDQLATKSEPEPLTGETRQGTKTVAGVVNIEDETDLARWDRIVGDLPEANRRYVEKQGERGVFEFSLSVAVTAKKKGLLIPDELMNLHPGHVEVWIKKQALVSTE